MVSESVCLLTWLRMWAGVGRCAALWLPPLRYVARRGPADGLNPRQINPISQECQGSTPPRGARGDTEVGGKSSPARPERTEEPGSMGPRSRQRAHVRSAAGDGAIGGADTSPLNRTSRQGTGRNARPPWDSLPTAGQRRGRRRTRLDGGGLYSKALPGDPSGRPCMGAWPPPCVWAAALPPRRAPPATYRVWRGPYIGAHAGCPPRVRRRAARPPLHRGARVGCRAPTGGAPTVLAVVPVVGRSSEPRSLQGGRQERLCPSAVSVNAWRPRGGAGGVMAGVIAVAVGAR
jgi:hypothetical protein